MTAADDTAPSAATMTYEAVPRHADERETLTAFLEWQRATLLRKCDGLTPEQLRTRSVPPSSLSLLGIVRHITDCERGWFRINLDGEDIGYRFSSDDDEDADFDDLESAAPEDVFSAWREECELARAVVARHALDDTGRHRISGRTMTLRWTLVHMIDEYSRHNGHADLLREAIDGATGY